MEDRELLKRITTNPKIMTGKPVIGGTRLTVEFEKNGRLGRAIAKPNIHTNTLDMLGFILQPNLREKDLHQRERQH